MRGALLGGFLLLASAVALAEEIKPTAWPRYPATIAKDVVNLRVEPSLKARLAPERAPKGTQLTVQQAANVHWYEILEPDEYRGFFVREDMLKVERPAKGP